MQIALTINAKNAFPHSLNKYWKKAFALLLCILFTLVASAQNHISGIVIDSLSQKPIAKANIMLLKDGKVVHSAVPTIKVSSAYRTAYPI